MSVKGDLKHMSLPNLVQMICMDRREATLVLRNRTEEGKIFFSKGQIIHAQVGQMIGEEAVYYLLSWSDGLFEMRDSPTLPTQTISAPWNHLLMEGMRLVDEQIVGLAIEEIEAKQELSPQEIQEDNQLEEDMILVMSRVDQIRARLSEKRTWKQPVLAMHLLRDMLHEISIFAEVLPGDASTPGYLQTVLERVGEVFPAAKVLRANNSYLSTDIAEQLYNNWSGSASERQKTFRELGEGMLAVLESYCGYCVGCFHSSVVAGQWRDTCEIFLAELRSNLEHVKF